MLPDGILIEPVPETLKTELAGFTMKSPEVFVIVSPDAEKFRSEERRVGKECRSRWSPYH